MFLRPARRGVGGAARGGNVDGDRPRSVACDVVRTMPLPLLESPPCNDTFRLLLLSALDNASSSSS